MSNCRRKVVLCKGNKEKNESAYIKEFESAGYICDHLPVLRFNFVNQQELQTHLQAWHRYSEAVALALKQVEETNVEQWQSFPTFCIGPATEALAINCGFKNCMGRNSGNSKELAKEIVTKNCRDSKPLFYPCSEIARDTLTELLGERGILVHKLVVYQTLPSETLQNDLSSIIEARPQIFIFFSPSVVEYVITALKTMGIALKELKAVAVGPVTEEALKNAGIQIHAVSEKPEPVALLEAILKLVDEEKSVTS
ncbi:uroporphyrinogen-III synthase isoform X2 [Orussus abietinus]|uniref:uroporphyrinogen-III synthase isoform X2 n=1 Tax=Orussus abietinus TaxID=222816 RepID=UPI0006261353|nr:uroporphyrinogen-III synthase isoform X2 [Orussus abietinus]